MSILDPPTTRTIACSFTNSGITPIVYPLEWTFFSGFNELASFYQFFKVKRYKIDVANSGTFSGSVAYLPFNYIVETVPSITSFTLGDLALLQGNLSVSPGGENRGIWRPWPFGTQQFSTQDASPNIAGIILGDTAVTTTDPIQVMVYVDVTFYRHYPFFTSSLTAVPRAADQKLPPLFD
jgi:hypothetical protein